MAKFNIGEVVVVKGQRVKLTIEDHDNFGVKVLWFKDGEAKRTHVSEDMLDVWEAKSDF